MLEIRKRGLSNNCVFVDLDGDRQSRSIGENGEAYFPAFLIVFADKACRFGLTPTASGQLSPIKKRALMARVFTYQFEEKSGRFLAESRIKMEIQSRTRTLNVVGM